MALWFLSTLIGADADVVGGLITIYVRLLPGYSTVSASERWSVHIPFRVYLGWITVATIANTTIVLYDQGWRGAPLNEPLWAMIMVVIATLVGLAFALRMRDVAYTNDWINFCHWNYHHSLEYILNI